MTSIYWLVMSLAIREPNAISVTVPRGVEFANKIVECAPQATLTERALLMSIGHHESRWDFNAEGDGGRALGAFQLHGPWRVGVALEDLTPCKQIELALDAMRYLHHVCGGSLVNWLGAYASGKCGGAPSKARELCAPVELCQ